ncbi:MAG TPA: hypothetical protein VID26_06750, partial [Candidatus Limnocylindrales bacterium]
MAVGRGVGLGVTPGVGVGDGQLPRLLGGDIPVCASKRKPSASPSPKTRAETPRLELAQLPPLRATKISQNGLLLVQQPDGISAGSPSIQQIA